ncbi:hypothetical protein [Psychrobacter sp. KH172YL61]|uniref:hypothetical protein n=1 Tax=Psychrobacter sp. KH172YL61 TaxID=2517899 RepID=UPI001F07EA47|nr:hypothetical protein [Psychrobacter sp. KH172YL61]
MPLNEWLQKTAIDQRSIGLAAMAKATHMYAMYIDKTETLRFSGLYQHADATQLRLSAIQKV